MKKEDNTVSFCTEPWKNIFLRNSGRVQPCCMNSTYLGNVKTDSLEDVWNNEIIQDVRKYVKEHNYDKAGCKSTCPTIYNFKNTPETELIPKKWENAYNNNENFRLNVNEYKKNIKKENLQITNTPITFDIQPIEACNMACIMCHQDHNSKDYVSKDDIDKLFFSKEKIYSIRFQGGEVFIDQEFTNYLIELKNEFTSSQDIVVITNGACLSNDELDKLSSGNNPVNFIISMDATDKEIFKYIRHSSQFDKVKHTLKYLSNIQKKKTFDFLTWNYIVMKSNFYDMKQAIILASELNIKLQFGAILGTYEDENIFDYPILREKEYTQYIEETIQLNIDLNAKVTGLDIIKDKLTKD